MAGGVANITRTMPLLRSLEHLPDMLTVVPVTVTVQLIPPRVDKSVPLAVLPLAVSVRRCLPRAAADPWNPVGSVG